MSFPPIVHPFDEVDPALHASYDTNLWHLNSIAPARRAADSPPASRGVLALSLPQIDLEGIPGRSAVAYYRPWFGTPAARFVFSYWTTIRFGDTRFHRLKRYTVMKSIYGFSLVEVLIVVSILGIMAAIVVPQDNSSTKDAQFAALRSNLHVVRKQLELYKIHHNGVWPAAVGETGADFARRMMTRTDKDGAAGTQFGPYLERVPVNKYNNRTSVRVGEAAAGANTDGWRFDPLTGEFQPDDNYDGNLDGVPDHVGL